MHRTAAWILCLLVALGGLGLWWQAGRPVDMVGAPDGHFQCASYTPPRSEPMRADTRIGREQIQRELAVLAERFHCVRTYSVNNGMDVVPEVARELGLRVLLGLWIGSDPAHNQREIALGLQVAERSQDVIDGIIVGNEVLLRRELTPDQLAVLLRQVNGATTLPVTYADVWDFWRRNPQLQADVDYITIHLLPYWEDLPSGIDEALRHTAETWGEARVTFPGKRLFIGETGWPSAGRQRDDAVPGKANQARFLREFTDWARREQAPYNLIEAYDQAWKRGQEGTVGGHWGLYSADLQPKFPLQGPVVDDPRWWRGPVAAGLATVLLLLAGLVLRRPGAAPSWGLLAVGGLAFGVLLPWQWDYAWAANRTTTEWSAMAVLWSLGSLLFLVVLWRLAHSGQGATLPVPAGIHACLRSLDRRNPIAPRGPQDPWRSLGLLRFGVLLGALYVALGLALDARYRGFPVAFYLLPALALLLLAWGERGRWAQGWRQQPEESGMAVLIGLCSVASMVQEGPLNLQAWQMGALGLLLAGSSLWPLRGSSAEQHQQGQ